MQDLLRAALPSLLQTRCVSVRCRGQYTYVAGESGKDVCVAVSLPSQDAYSVVGR